MGRTEDVRLTPSGRRLAFACYAKERIAVADVEISLSGSGSEIGVTSLDQFASTDLREPHGLDFVDDETLIVANRAGGLATFRLPPGASGELTRIDPVGSDGRRLPEAPGSVAVRSLGGEQVVLACDNWADTVTRHALDGGGVPAAGELVLRKWLDLPDGLAVGHDGHWLAVSNHNSHSVLVYAYETLNDDADPVGILRGVNYPHGLRFAAGDRFLVVADAGAPYVHVFVPSGGGWQGASYPAASIRVMDDDTFARGRSPHEGGPKGIDLDPRTDVLVVTSERLPLAFFDLGAVLDRGAVGPAEDALLRYELDVLAEQDQIKAATDEVKAQLTEVLQTKAWRLTLPARRAYGAALYLRSRLRSRRAPSDS